MIPSLSLWQLWGYSDYSEQLKLAVRNSPLSSAVVNRPWDFVSGLWQQTVRCQSCKHLSRAFAQKWW